MTCFILGGPKTTADGDCSHEIKRCLLLGRKAMINLISMLKKKQRHHFANKGVIVKAIVFQVVMYKCELDHKEDWVLKNWCFWIMVLDKTLESPLDSKEIKSVNLKEIIPEYSLEGSILKVKLQYFGCLILRADSLEKTLMLVKSEGRRRRSNRG